MRLGEEIRLILVEPEEIEVDEEATAARRAELEAYRAKELERRRAAIAREYDIDLQKRIRERHGFD